jgi:hypothetical protein
MITNDSPLARPPCNKHSLARAVHGGLEYQCLVTQRWSGNGRMRNEGGANCRDVEMSEAVQGPDLTMTGDRELSEADIEAFAAAHRRR